MFEKLNFLSAQEMQKARMQICFSCPELGIIAVAGIAKCNSCGCPIRSKVALKSSTCPLDKW
jgi:hypothetical protein